MCSVLYGVRGYTHTALFSCFSLPFIFSIVVNPLFSRIWNAAATTTQSKECCWLSVSFELRTKITINIAWRHTFDCCCFFSFCLWSYACKTLADEKEPKNLLSFLFWVCTWWLDNGLFSASNCSIHKFTWSACNTLTTKRIFTPIMSEVSFSYLVDVTH